MFTISQNLQEKTGVLFLTKMMAVKRISANGCFWVLEIYFYNCKRLSRTENYAHTIRFIWPKFVKVHFLNFLYDHKDYANFDNALSIIMRNFPEPIRLETKSSLGDYSKFENFDWERDVLNFKKLGQKL